MNLVKKFSVFALMIATVVSMSGGLTVKAAGNYPAGSLLAKANTSGAAVYYIGSDGMKYVFPDVKTYETWYENFDSVQRVSTTELDMYPDGGAVTYREGTYLVTNENSNKVYAVEPGGILRWIPTAETASALYGANWGSKVRNVIPGFFSSSYTVGSNLGSTLPTGTIAMEQGGDTYYRIDGTTKRPFASMDAFEANNFNLDFVVTANLAGYTAGTSITGEEISLSGFMPSDEEVVTPVDGNLTVSLSAATPAAQDVPELSPNEFLAFKLAAGSTAASVEAITLTSFGLGDSQDIDNVTLYQDGVKVGTSKNVNSDKKATFNFTNGISINANSSVTLVAKATIASTATGGTYGLKVASASDVVTGGSVGGSFPVSGNLMTAVSVSNLGTVGLSNPTNEDNNVSFGEDNVKLAEFTLDTANEPILWETARFRNGGTNSSDVVSNLRIEVDGDVVDEDVSLNDKYVDFDMNSLLIEKGQSVKVEVYGDIGVASVNNTVDLYIDNAADFSFMGQDYGYGIELTSIASLDEAGDGIKAILQSSDFTIDMDKSATPNKDVRGGDDNVVLATISFTSNGEDATINDISDTSGSNGDFYVQSTNAAYQAGEVTNFELRDVDSGVIYDVTETASTTLKGWTLAMTDEISLEAGVTKTFELRVDLSGANDSAPIDDGDTLKVYLESSAMNVTGNDSDAAITDITPSSISGSTATVRAGALTLSTVSMTNKSVVGGAGTEEAIEVFKTGLEVGESSDLTLTSVRIDADDTYYAAFTDDNIAQLDLYIVDGTTEKLLKSTSNDIVNDGLTTGYITFSSLNNTNRVLTAGSDVELVVKAIFASTLPDTGSFALESVNTAGNIAVADEDSVNVVEVLENADTDSRLITVSTKGTLKAELLTSDTSANDDFYILAGTETTDRYLGELRFTTANEEIELTDLALQEYQDAGSDDIKVVKLYDETGAVVAYKTPSVNGHVYFEAADFIDDANILAADETTSFFIGVLTKSMNADGDAEGTADFDEGIQFSFATSTALNLFGLGVDEAVKATGVDSAEEITIIEDTNGTVAAGEYALASVKTKTATTTGSILTMITNDMEDGTLAGGTSKIVGQYTFVFDNGSNRTTANETLKAQLRQLILNVASSTTLRATNFKAYIEGNSANKTDAAQPNASSEVTIDLTQLDGETNLVDGTVTLVILADINVTGDNQYIQTEIDDLTTDFTYNGNHDDGSTYWSNARLDGITDVAGATLSY